MQLTFSFIESLILLLILSGILPKLSIDNLLIFLKVDCQIKYLLLNSAIVNFDVSI